MKELIKKYFQIDKSAYASVRGFYFQHLITVSQIVDKFSTDKDFDIAPEVMNDVDIETKDEIKFIQVKSYGDDLYFNSNIVRKALIDFFITYLFYETSKELKFQFLLNSSIKPKDKGLLNWIESKNEKDKTQILKYMHDEISAQIEKKKKNIKDKAECEILDSVCSELISKVEKNFDDFYVRIEWVTENESPYASIERMENEVKQVLNRDVFKKHNSKLLFDSLMVLVYKKSSQKNDSDRHIVNKDIQDMLSQNDNYLSKYLATDLNNRKLRTIRNFQTLKKQVIPKKTFPDMDWDDACWEIAINFKSIENRIDDFIYNDENLLEPTVRKQLEELVSICINGEFEGVEKIGDTKEVKSYGYECADKVFKSILKISNELDKNLG